jgi:hypothetical protein
MIANKSLKKDLTAETEVKTETSLEQAKTIQDLQQEVEKMKKERNSEKEQQQDLEKDPGEDHMSKREPKEEEEPKETQAVVRGVESLKNNIHCRYGPDCYSIRGTGNYKFLHKQHHPQRGFKSAKPCRDGNYCKRLSCNFTHLLECRFCKIKCGSPKEMETHMRVHSSRQLVSKGENTMKLENTQKVTKKHARQEFPDKKQVDSHGHQQHQQQSMMSQRMGIPASMYDQENASPARGSWSKNARVQWL